MGHALQVVDDSPVTITNVRAAGLLRPLASPTDVVKAQNETRALVKEALVEDRDFGTIPGTNKATLLKPGAERLSLGFGLAPRFAVAEREIDHDREVKYMKRKKVWRNQFKGDKHFDWQEEAGMSLGLYRYVINCEMVHRDSGVVIAACIGSCSTMESKYIDRPRDVENTIIKMAEKRAFVGAVLLALGLSDEFTQDVEDLVANGVIDAQQGEPPASPREAKSASNDPEPTCPKCSGKMWDNRDKKSSPKAPDYKCRDKGCDGVFWPGQWPPKSENAQEESGPMNTSITRDTVLTFGTFEGTKIKDLSDDFLRWANEDGRKFGPRTSDWQDAFRLELERRSEQKLDAPLSDDNDDPDYLPF